MAFAIKLSIFAPILVVVVVVLNSLIISSRSESQFPCFFILGDSLVDNGNNNELATEANVNYLPYGIDFLQGPTGRFTNGRNIVDFFAELLGFDTYIPPFATTKGRDIIKGVNYGSGTSGILNETGQHLGNRISMARQLANHKQTISSISKLIGTNTNDATSNNNLAKQHLSKCLYYVWTGSNDYINNYFVPEYYTTSNKYTTEQYTDLLIQQYSVHLTTLYNYGARNVAISPLLPLGCIPLQLRNASSCAGPINDAIQLFNKKLEFLVRDLNSNLPNAKFIHLVDLFSPAVVDLLSPGIKLISKPCCKVTSSGFCIPGEPPCLARALHLFFDGFHPTEGLYKALAAASYVKIRALI